MWSCCVAYLHIRGGLAVPGGLICGSCLSPLQPATAVVAGKSVLPVLCYMEAGRMPA